jgi:hypothetical protein
MRGIKSFLPASTLAPAVAAVSGALGVFCLLTLTTAPVLAAPKAKAKGKAVAAAPQASAAEIDKLKGDFKWNMTPEEVLAKAVEKVEASYEDRLNKTAKDPSQQDRIRKQLRAEVQKLKKNAIVKFDGEKTGWDVSIIDQEFVHNSSESMLVAKEENSDRYFFFSYDKLFKMFIAFDKEMLQGKSFEEFGKLMQTRFGKAKEVYVEQTSKAGTSRKLDHYLWGSKSGDMLRLVDRSAFYGVYCLVIYDERSAATQAEARKAQAKTADGDSLVEAVVSGGATDRDSNDNIIDRITGRAVHKPGEGPQPQDIVVPSPVTGLAPSVREVNRAAASGGEPKGEPAKTSEKPAKPKEGRSKETQGLEL